MSVWKLALLFVLAALGDWWWKTHLSFWGLSPQWLLVLTVAVAARQGAVRAMGMGFLWGLFLDAWSARLFGANALALTLVGYGAGSARRQVEVADLAPQTLIVLFMTWAYFLLTGLLGAVFMKHFLWVGWTAFLLDPFYNVLAMTAVFLLWPSRRER